MKKVVISGTGLFTPKNSISNEELVVAFNAWAAAYNRQHAEEIAAGKRQPQAESSAEFILKASGIRQRFVLDKAGILDPQRMKPNLPERSNAEPSLQCEMAIVAAKQAMQRAGCAAADLDGVIVACSNMQRPYPSVAIEVQAALGIEGFAYDMNVACSSATFGIQNATAAIQSGQARAVLMVNPEICTGHLDFRDRDSHFIFGDACTAVILQDAELACSKYQWEVLDCQLKTVFSNAIRNNFGFLNRCADEGQGMGDKLFVQEGRKVFREVCPMVAAQLAAQLAGQQLTADQVSRFWLHQANLSMNQLIIRRLLGHEAAEGQAPIILDTYANTSSAGSVIALHLHQDDLPSGALGVLCSFGAGYSIGSVLLKKV